MITTLSCCGGIYAHQPTCPNHQHSWDGPRACATCRDLADARAHPKTYGTTDAQGFRDMRPDEPVNFRVEVSDDNGRTYATNGLRWADQADASAWAFGLSMRWFGCTNIRVVREATGEVVDTVL